MGQNTSSFCPHVLNPVAWVAPRMSPGLSVFLLPVAGRLKKVGALAGVRLRLRPSRREA